ncbi:MAG TPA: SPOR domain-containing protein, partial [Halioglobus sp.]
VAARTAVPEPAVPEPAVPEPAVPEPAVPKLAVPETTVPQPAVPKLAVPETTAPKSATTRSATSSGPWFVNFGSYATRAMADTWATRLHPNRGEVIVAANTRDGKTLYRVRVVGLDSRNSAMDVARTLESELRVSALWVGKD